MLINCPICKKSVEWDGNLTRPFCSERCRILDLGAWLVEEYRVPAEEFHLEEATPDEEKP
jgi:endogenous inhibitor of DNA gyrase (YacG/DUF329 family)